MTNTDGNPVQQQAIDKANIGQKFSQKRAPGCSAAMTRYLMEEKAFRSSQRQWSRPSPGFKAPNVREQPPPHGCGADVVYNAKNGTIEQTARKGARKPSAAFVSKSPQRPSSSRSPESAAGAAGHNDHHVSPPLRPLPKGPKVLGTACAAFRSTTPRMGEGPKLCDGQQLLAASAKSRSPSRGAVAFFSKRPRLLPTPTPVCDGVYDITKQPNRPRTAGAWSRSTTAQRPDARSTSIDAPPMTKFATDISAMARRRSAAAPVFHSTTPRFACPRSTTPPVGQYTSKFVSHGMVA